MNTAGLSRYSLVKGLPSVAIPEIAIAVEAQGKEHLCLMLPYNITKSMLSGVVSSLWKPCLDMVPIILSVNGGITNKGMDMLILWVQSTGLRLLSFWATHHMMTSMMPFKMLFQCSNWQKWGYIHLSHGNMPIASVREFLTWWLVNNQKMFSLIRLNKNPEVADIILDSDRLYLGFYQFITIKDFCPKGMLNIQVDDIVKRSTDTSYQHARLHEKTELIGLAQTADSSELVQKTPITLADYVIKKHSGNKYRNKNKKGANLTMGTSCSETESSEIGSTEIGSIRSRSEIDSSRSMS